MAARLLALTLLALAPGSAAGADLAGRVTLAIDGASLADLGPTVVYLDAGGTGAAPPPATGRAVVRQHNARFEPEFIVVVEGQTVEMPNDDTIFHNVFSFSRPNDFDLGMYPAGSSRRVRFRHAGLVRLYCSIHESMQGTILVAPTPWFARVTASGDYYIRGVPPGTYRLAVWNERLPALARPVTLTGDGTRRVDLALGGDAP